MNEKLLIITQKVDRADAILGFFHEWIAGLSGHFKTVTVICLEEGDHNLPGNVRVLSLGKEVRRSRFRYLVNFYVYLWKERRNYDAVFVHMNQIYVILGWVIWKYLGKKITLWYTHKSTPLSLWVAEKMAQRIFSASGESFRLSSRKLLVTGHGIDTDRFAPAPGDLSDDSLKIVTVGRIAPIKKTETIIEAIRTIRDIRPDLPIELTIVGGPICPPDFEYLEKLRDLVKRSNLESVVKFAGAVPPGEVPGYLQRSNLFVHESQTGSLDKAGLEAMSAGLIVISSNDAMRPILEPFGLTFKNDDVSSLSGMILKAKDLLGKRKEIGLGLRHIVTENHSLRSLISLLARNIKE